jgi:2-polyprenyl-6-methoxyphenol hydroxylase-like FAD-dependent oxidoreductase
MPSLPERSTEVLVVGAGPVGLFAALCAARDGLDVMIVDQTWQGFARGYATILHPRSLGLLRQAGLGDELVRAGRLIHEVSLYVDKEHVCRLALDAPALAIAQSTFEETLLRALQGLGVRPHAPFQATTIEQDGSGVNVRLVRRELVRLGSPALYSDWEPVDSSVLRAKFVIGADGYDSRVRAALGIETVTVGSTETFSIFEFPSSSPAGDIELCFENELASAMIPLPNERARWSFQLASGFDRVPDLERLRTLLAERAPWYQDGSPAIDWGSVMHFERRLARSFGQGRIWLAGDAAHVTNPFGGQSMNGGLFEAHELASRMAACSNAKHGLEDFEHYARGRRREWHKLLGVNVTFELLPNAATWLPLYARKILPALPASGRELDRSLADLGLRVH